MGPINQENFIGQEQYKDNTTKPSDSSSSDNSTVVVPDNTNRTRPGRNDEKFDDHPANDWIHDNKLWIIIGAVVFVLLVVAILWCSCFKPKKDDYKHKTYSAISEEAPDYGTGINN